jgi:tetratricopeptide (TPR) repeat protein
MNDSPRAVPALVTVALLAIAGSLAGCGGPEARRASHIARGQHYLADGKLEKARVEFANALQIAPQDAQVRYLMGQVSERLGDPRGAAAMYQGAIDVDPGQLQARASLARLYLYTSHPEKALSLIEPALARQPDNPRFLTVRAAARLRLKDPTGALADVERAVQLSPSDPEAVSALAGVYRETGHPEQALKLLQSAIERAPDAVGMRQLLAGMYVARGEDKLAEAQLTEVVRIRPKELAARLQLAAFYARSQRLDEAERTLQAAAADLPGSEEAKLAYAEFLASHRSAARGEQALEALIAHDPRNYALQLALGALRQRSGETPQAVATYRAVIARDPRGPAAVTARDRIAAIDVLGGRYADAKPLLAEALESNPHDNDALVLRADLSLRDGDPLAAIADFRAVLRDQPGSVSVLRSLARAHLANGSPVLAEESLRSALAAAPQDVDVRVDLADLLMRTHRAAEAATLLEETVKASPSATAARTALIEAYLAKGDLAAARSAAEQLKTAQPDLSAGWYLAGQIAERQHRADDAERELGHALQLEPATTDALAALARLQLARGQGAQALALVRSAIQRMPANAGTHELLGELYLAQKGYTEAISALSDAVRLAPRWWLPYRNLALTKLATRDTAGALATYEAGVRVTGEPALVVDLAEAYLQQGRVEDAVRAYENLHQRRPNLPLAANNLAMLLVTYRHDQASLDRARDLTTGFADSGEGALLDTYGWVRLKRGEVPEALAALERASAEAPGSKVILYHLGMAYLEAGESERARTSLEAALAGGASFTGMQEARLALAQLKGRTG